MRPSSPTQNRLLRTPDVAQYSLPYPDEVARSTAENETAPAITSRVRRSGRQIAVAQPVEAQEANLARQRRGMQVEEKKSPARILVPPDAKLLVSREEAAQLLSISVRGIDYLIATRRLPTRRIGGRILIPVTDLRKYVRGDHPERIVS